ncbi:uncharacterized protein LOC143922413 [Arctopsyche grandis]|uniref:uncharacterized protein LOC143922413 n=1 Tax=Arctopsyche grandis TaxID=121162 RepID=UPI00406D80E3
MATQLRRRRGALRGMLTRNANLVEQLPLSSPQRRRIPCEHGTILRPPIRHIYIYAVLDKLDAAKRITLSGGTSPPNDLVPVDQTVRRTVDQLATPPVDQPIRLPALELPTFDGKLEDWPQFSQRFQAAIYGSKVDSVRFQYLTASLTGEARNIIRGLDCVEGAFTTAWSILEDRYNNKRLLVQRHVQALLDAEPVGRDVGQGLRRLVDDITMHVRTLGSMGVPVDKWDDVLVSSLSSKLDRYTARQWDMQSVKYEDWTFEKFSKSFLRFQCQVQMNGEAIERMHQPRQCITGSCQDSRSSREVVSCPKCRGDHVLHSCSSFRDLAPPERISLVRRANLCRNCLRPGHNTTACKSQTRCSHCPNLHHTLLHAEFTRTSKHLDAAPVPRAASFANEAPHAPSLHALQSTVRAATTPRTILLSTVVLSACGGDGRWHKCRTLLDSGSELNIISNDMRRRLNVQPHALNARRDPQDHEQYSVQRHVGIAAGVAPTCRFIKDGRRNISIPPSLTSTRSSTIHLLSTSFGWVVSGELSAVPNANISWGCHLSLVQSIRAFWELEEPSPNNDTLDEVDPTERLFRSTTTRDESGRFVVRLPFLGNSLQLGASRVSAESRLRSLEARLTRNPEMQGQYRGFLQEYMELGHMSEYGAETGPHFYLPHHAVLKAASLTTKLRVVFDGSAKTSSGSSLNDLLRVGPRLQDDIFNILLRFRQHRFVMTADIAKMYRQILVHPEDRRFQRILWRANGAVKPFELNTVTYGTACASFLATKCLRQLATDHGAKFQRAFYVDDLLSGADNAEDLMTLARQITWILSQGGFPLRKWSFNTAKPLSEYPSLESNGDDCHIITKEESPTLGLNWHTRADSFSISVRINATPATTKRGVLSQIARVFDPLGLLGPTVVIAKLLMQELFRSGLDWDATLPAELSKRWSTLAQSLPEFRTIHVPRHVLLPESVNVTLLAICDASQIAYGACVYALCLDKAGNGSCRLLCAKSRVAPLKAVTILFTLMNRVRSTINIDCEGVLLWTDSTVVLAWLKGESSRWVPFVAHRVAKIQSISYKHSWAHVRSQDNPADILSRGMLPQELQNNHLWWNGPDWILSPRSRWPRSQGAPVDEVQLEVRRTPLVLTIRSSDWTLITSQSSWKKLVRITAYCLRYISALTL